MKPKDARKPSPAQNSAPEPTSATGKPFPKGTSGNPGGRPKAVRELLERARESVPKALAFAEGLLDDETAEPRVRLDAAKWLAAYGLGAPPKVLPEDEADHGAEQLTQAERVALSRSYLDAMRGKISAPPPGALVVLEPGALTDEEVREMARHSYRKELDAQRRAQPGEDDDE